jgi:elongation factor G
MHQANKVNVVARPQRTYFPMPYRMLIVLPHPDWPNLPYLETIQWPSEQEYKFLEHGRGRSEYAHALIRIEPLPIGTGTRFENRAAAALPEQFIPAIRSGIAEALFKGPIVGAEITDVSIILVSGSYHQTDSSDRAFQTAARNAFTKAFQRSVPVLLEPIMRVHLTVSETSVGELSNEISRRRGEVKGMDSKTGSFTVEAWLPLAETVAITRFVDGLSFGQAKISAQFLRYEKAPSQHPPDQMTVPEYT